MNDVLRVDVLHPVHQLAHVEARLRLRHHVTRLEHMHQRLPGTVLQHNVDIVRVLKVLDELYNVLVSEGAVELYLA